MLIYIITNYGRIYKKNKRKEQKITLSLKMLEKEQNQLNKHINILEIHLGLLTSNAGKKQTKNM